MQSVRQAHTFAKLKSSTKKVKKLLEHKMWKQHALMSDIFAIKIVELHMSHDKNCRCSMHEIRHVVIIKHM